MKRPEDGANRKREKFVQDVLARTSGSACKRALDMLPLLATDELGDMDRSLVQGHLEHCGECRSVAVVLNWVGGELPAMASLDPGPQFTALVLSRTAKLPSPAAARGQLTGAAGLMDRLGHWWEKRIRRPLFVWQVAYALTVLLVGLTSLPPLRGVPDRILETVQAGPTNMPFIGEVLEAAGNSIDAGAGFLVQGVRQEVGTGWRGVSGNLRQRIGRTEPDRRALSLNISAMWAGLRRGSPGPTGLHLLEAGRAFKDMWRHWWRLEISEAETTSERSPS